MKLSKKQNPGFSLIEVIIAFSILTITVLASTSLISSSIQNNQENILRVQAYFLAQEGIELTRAYRDSVILNNEDFDGSLSGEKTIEFASNPNLITLTTGQPSELYLNNGYFSHTPTENKTPFTRTIKIEQVPNIDTAISISSEALKSDDFDLNKSAKLITSKVEYEFNAEPKTIEITTILTDWKEATK